MPRINFGCSREEHDKLVEIARRYERMLSQTRFVTSDDWRTLLMDVTACHCNGCPLDLDLLLSAPDLDFAHDLGGIQRHMDRTTGKLEGFFVPRCAKH